VHRRCTGILSLTQEHCENLVFLIVRLICLSTQMAPPLFWDASIESKRQSAKIVSVWGFSHEVMISFLLVMNLSFFGTKRVRIEFKIAGIVIRLGLFLGKRNRLSLSAKAHGEFIEQQQLGYWGYLYLENRYKLSAGHKMTNSHCKTESNFPALD